MSTYEQVQQLTSKLSLADKVRLLEYLSAALKHDLETVAYQQIPWEQFIDATYGSFVDDPIERHQPLLSDARDAIE